MLCKEEEDEVNAYLLTKPFLWYDILDTDEEERFYLEGKSATPSHQSTSISPTVSDESSDISAMMSHQSAPNTMHNWRIMVNVIIGGVYDF